MLDVCGSKTHGSSHMSHFLCQLRPDYAHPFTALGSELNEPNSGVRHLILGSRSSSAFELRHSPPSEGTLCHDPYNNQRSLPSKNNQQTRQPMHRSDPLLLLNPESTDTRTDAGALNWQLMGRRSADHMYRERGCKL
ncbi:hypothetical protein O6H91_Y488000 [Diphasiastrum complanatum]|nr:hypothetical protein O6H91_Y488000 [Diphasiastrum complanatum]